MATEFALQHTFDEANALNWADADTGSGGFDGIDDPSLRHFVAQGSITSQSEFAATAIHFKENQSVTIDIDFADGQASGLDAMLWVIDAAGNLVFRNDDTVVTDTSADNGSAYVDIGDGDFYSADSRISFIAPTSGVYYVVVSGYGNRYIEDALAFDGGGFPDGDGSILDGIGSFQLDIASDITPAVPIATMDMALWEVWEGDPGFTPIVSYEVELSQVAEQDISISFRAVDDSAVYGEDFEFLDHDSKEGTLTISKGSTSGTINVRILSDDIGESDEQFGIELLDSPDIDLPGGASSITYFGIIRNDNDVIRDAGELTLPFTELPKEAEWEVEDAAFEDISSPMVYFDEISGLWTLDSKAIEGLEWLEDTSETALFAKAAGAFFLTAEEYLNALGKDFGAPQLFDDITQAQETLEAVVNYHSRIFDALDKALSDKLDNEELENSLKEADADFDNEAGGITEATQAALDQLGSGMIVIDTDPNDRHGRRAIGDGDPFQLGHYAGVKKSGGFGSDAVIAKASGQQLTGSFGDDILVGRGSSDILDGGNHKDRLLGGEGADIIDGGLFSDTINGGDGNDVISGGTSTAPGGHDSLSGGGGKDKLDGFGGEDTIDGGAGNDLIAGGHGKDDNKGGPGIDRIDYGRLAWKNGIEVYLGSGIIREPDSRVDRGQAAQAAIIEDKISGVENVSATNYNDIIFGSLTANKLNGNNGNDYINGGGRKDIILGGGGDDTVIGGTGGDQLRGDAGSDMFTYLSLRDSAVERDRIMDFNRNFDLINVRSIDANATVSGNQNFIYGGTSGSFTAGRIQAVQLQDNKTLLQFNTDNDIDAEMTILLMNNNALRLKADDFIL